ncbi:MAG: enoyl-CoA hydratase/isomerase family protein [Candidatus Nezhaarchaeota archaeon]|nr:enoyl-CoA hydratase/isomerase family protein [Candidatus Nezhaarchaeota archaeon]
MLCLSSFTQVKYDKEDGVAWVTINRPRVLNVLNAQTIEELSRALDDAERDDSVRVVVITGEGDRAFCAGIDVNEFIALSPIKRREFTISYRERIINKIRGMGKPVVAMVNGYALGAGCELAMTCDLAIASENARFGQPEVNIAAIPGGGGTQLLPRHVGLKKAMELIMTGDLVDAKEAEGLGIVNKVVPLDKLRGAVKELADKLKSKSPVALKFIKAAVNKSAEALLPAGLAYETEAFTLCSTSEDFSEGVRAFLEKRKPTWRGK